MRIHLRKPKQDNFTVAFQKVNKTPIAKINYLKIFCFKNVL